ncbi:MAG: peptide ABC transporter substrate-binding protein [Caulobacteraceae bacterium]
MRGRLKSLFLCAAALVLLTGCAGKSGRPPCPAGKLCMFQGNGSDPDTIDPALSQSTWEEHIIDDVMVGLVANDAKGDPAPALATSWQSSPDGLTWTFHLRDAQWSDGHPVTADDFVYGMQRVLDPKLASAYANLLYFLVGAEQINAGKAPPSSLGVKAIDAHTLELRLTHPAPYLLQIAKHTVMMPAPRWVVEKTGGHWAEPGNFVSTGPYVMTEWKLGDHITVVKNPRFYDAAQVCLDQVVYYPAEDKISAERRVRAGEFDLNGQNGMLPSRIPYLKQPDQIPAYVHTYPWLATEYFQFNIANVPAFKDVRVRQALTMAIDRDFIASKLMLGGFIAANTFTPPGTADYTTVEPPHWAGWSLAKRQAEARRLMAAAGYGPGHPLKITMDIRGSVEASPWPSSVQADWKAIGVTAEITREETQVAYADFNSGNFQVANPGWVADFDDPLTFLGLLRKDAGVQNYGRYFNPTYDALTDQANLEPDLQKRAVLMAKAEHLMLEDAAVAPIWFQINYNLVNPWVTGWVDNIGDKHPSRYICFAGRKQPQS